MSSIETLAATISEQVARLSTLHREAGSNLPSLSEEGAKDYASSTNTSTDVALQDVRRAILGAADELLRLVRGPTEQILTMTWSVSSKQNPSTLLPNSRVTHHSSMYSYLHFGIKTCDVANINLITQLKLPQLVPRGSTITVQELSASASIDQDYLLRIVQFAIANGIFTEPTPGVIGHSSLSAALAENDGLRKMVTYSTEFLSDVIAKVPDQVLRKRADGEDAPKTAFNISHQTTQDIFQYFHENSDKAAKYHAYLAGRGDIPFWSIKRLCTAKDWPTERPVTLVDVGGARGEAVRALASVMPHAKFTVQDSNDVALEGGRQAISANPELTSRIDFMKHDFFTPQPCNADFYLFRHILHDWNDENCVKILSSLTPALKPGAQILISEGVLPAPPASRLSTLDQKFIRIEDMFMLAVHDAKERSELDFDSLFEAVKPGAFRKVSSSETPGPAAFQSLLAYEMPLNIVIVGGGIAGITAGAALARSGHQVQIFEKSAFALEIGAAVFMAPNGIKVLQSLGFELAKARASKLDNWAVASGVDLAKLEVLDLAHAPTSFGTAYYAIHRMDLHAELMRLANIASGCEASNSMPSNPRLSLSSPVVKVDALEGRVELADGTVHQADVVIGADGLHSVVREAVVAGIRGSDLLHTQLNAFRFLIPTQDLMAIPEGRDLMNWKSPGLALFVDTNNMQAERTIVWYPCRDGTIQNFVGIHPAEKNADKNLDFKTQMLREFGHFNPKIVSLLGIAQDIKIWPLYAMDPLPEWSRGRTVLVGDASHPMLPFSGQAANQAIEDGAVLGRLFAGVEDSSLVPSILKRFERLRIKRTSRIQTLSSVRAKSEHLIRDKIQPYMEPGVQLPATLSERLFHDASFDALANCN
ncbi:hypothetical protein NLG97_g5608 [Lecanicillium saksenae]|uniref:Uncharacterized protein n=1 Tax=Lecanicillium saksenae TaxID=468837 RepID=A0ACC1QS61_9HYPO|nr:hypothetical protein NLG97_g5608 [Lecanicillium saksenae]